MQCNTSSATVDRAARNVDSVICNGDSAWFACTSNFRKHVEHFAEAVEIRNDKGTDSTLIANACVVVSLDIA